MKLFCKKFNLWMEKDYDSVTRSFICIVCDTLHIGRFGYICCEVLMDKEWTFFCTKEFFLKILSEEVLWDIWDAYKGKIRISLDE